MGRIREMGFTMKRIFMQLAAVVLAVAVAVPMAAPARAARNDELTLRVGLAYGSSALVSANLENNTGYGSGYRFGYYDSRSGLCGAGPHQLQRYQADHGQGSEYLGQRHQLLHL